MPDMIYKRKEYS